MKLNWLFKEHLTGFLCLLKITNMIKYFTFSVFLRTKGILTQQMKQQMI